jgi:hypothetical protein
LRTARLVCSATALATSRGSGHGIHRRVLGALRPVPRRGRVRHGGERDQTHELRRSRAHEHRSRADLALPVRQVRGESPDA